MYNMYPIDTNQLPNTKFYIHASFLISPEISILFTIKKKSILSSKLEPMQLKNEAELDKL